MSHKTTTEINLYGRGLAIGICTAVVLSLIMIPLFKAGISPLPKPLGLAFAEQLLGKVPLPVGLLFHVAYVTFWAMVYVVVFNRKTFLNALILGLGLWTLVAFVFFPFVGWGILGLAISPKLAVATLAAHLLFALFLWTFTKWGLSRAALA